MEADAAVVMVAGRESVVGEVLGPDGGMVVVGVCGGLGGRTLVVLEDREGKIWSSSVILTFPVEMLRVFRNLYS
jgi:hypothetical protein